MPGQFDDDKEVIRSLIGRTLNLPLSRITNDAELGRDLPADSLTMLEIVLVLEGRFQIEIPDAEYSKLVTLEQITRRVAELKQARSASAAVTSV
ncbi:MAG: phosphopantetheine-binding protein [Candidatus Sulfotelmatobacter sp.]